MNDFLLGMILLILVGGCRSTINPKTDNLVNNSIENNAAELLEDPRIHSVSIGVFKDGKTYIGHFGEIDIGQNNPPTDNTLYEIASITKTMVGTLVAKAVLENKLSLDDDIRKYLDGDYPNMEFNGKPVTLRAVLTHMGGIPSNFPEIAEHYETNEKNDSTFFKVAEIQKNLTKKDFFDLIRTNFLTEEPGTSYKYSNISPHLVAHILEKIYGQKFEEMMEEQIFKKYNMPNAIILDEEIPATLDYPEGYNENGLKMPHLPPELWYAAGDVKATIPDMMSYLKAQVNETDPVVIESHQKVFKREGGSYGGYFFGIEQQEDVSGFIHNGYGSGTQSWIAAYPKYDLGVCVITNTSFPDLNTWITVAGLVDDLKPFGKKSIQRAITKTCKNDIQAGIKLYQKLKKENPTQYNFDDENELNNLGYDFLFSKKLESAVEIFKLLVSEFPENSNPYDSLGEGYMNLEKYDLAILNYKKSLTLNPENTNAVKMLEKIEEMK